MPELPEVETVRTGLSPHIEDAVVQDVIVRQPQLRYLIDTAQLKREMLGQKIHRLRRRAKYLLLDFAEGTLLIHLGMTGVLRVLPADTPMQKHDHVDLILTNGKIIRFKDTRRFGAMLWLGDASTHPLLTRLGEEPLTPEFNPDTLARKLKRTQRAIKLALMDQSVVVGVGNIYANEALFEAKIHPLKPAHTLRLAEVTLLVTAVKRILAEAISRGGTTLKDFLSIEGQPGYFSQTLKIYGRKDQPCIQCHTPITKTIIGQRASYFCSQCQDILS